MHIVGRYHRVRPIGPHGIGAPYIWDRGRAQERPRLIPAPYDKGERWPNGLTRYGEWWQSPDGVWTPSVRGGAGGTYTQGLEFPSALLFDGTPSGTQTTLALDSNYVNASSGDAIAARFALPQNDTLSNVYFFVVSYTGTAANVNDLNLELRNNSATTGPSSTLHEGKTFDPASGTSWLKSTGWTFSLVAGTRYWIIVGDADGNGTDFATVLRNTSSWISPRDYGRSNAAQTTDGWASVRTFATAASSIVMAFGSGRTLGNPMTLAATTPSNTNRRGLRFVAPTTCKIFALMHLSSSATITGAELWEGNTGPSGTPAATGATDLGVTNVTANTGGYAFETPPTITQGTTYRIVSTYSSATTVPVKISIGTGADDTLRSAMLGRGQWYFAGANGTTDWSNDDTSAWPGVGVMIEDFVTNTSGGISSGLHTIMDGIVA